MNTMPFWFPLAVAAIPFITLVLPYAVYEHFRLKRNMAEVEFRARLKYGEKWEDHVMTLWS